MEEIKQDLRQFILKEFLPGEDPANLKDSTPLLSTGILNSSATLMVVMFLEERCRIHIQAHETSADNFDSIDRIVRFVRLKLA